MSCSQDLIDADGNLYAYNSPLIGLGFLLFPRVDVIPIYYVLICDLPDVGL